MKQKPQNTQNRQKVYYRITCAFSAFSAVMKINLQRAVAKLWDSQ
jgi:hypothetical protein